MLEEVMEREGRASFGKREERQGKQISRVR